MLNIKRDIHSLSDFKRKTPEFIDQLEKTGEPVILTMNGRARVVVQDADSYQRLREAAERSDTLEAIRAGLDDIANGRTMSLDEFDNRMRKRFNFPKGK